jgi:hypothetical protein
MLNLSTILRESAAARPDAPALLHETRPSYRSTCCCAAPEVGYQLTDSVRGR